VEESWSDWDSPSEQQNTMCLFCQFVDNTPEDILDKHIAEQHQIHLPQAFQELGLSFYDRVKVINFIRRCNFEMRCFSCPARFSDYERLEDHLNEHLLSTDFKQLLPKREIGTFWENPMSVPL
jgi:hypothetical protein